MLSAPVTAAADVSTELELAKQLLTPLAASVRLWLRGVADDGAAPAKDSSKAAGVCVCVCVF